ncbi:uncharacterized protein PV06_06574 [Exophiala oligosperma]|uniref:Uncharacterized protein n=1 Tax=Exophiala oligosperma TaxID=215243 RepID=A0A0D2DEY9_9EURO|nr:uncharacterized protein PV06_06574 [Exophiala oligosperma]KIW40975.1 hypothetical protein PV06_06574 [Exophiala oligosperma]
MEMWNTDAVPPFGLAGAVPVWLPLPPWIGQVRKDRQRLPVSRSIDWSLLTAEEQPSKLPQTGTDSNRGAKMRAPRDAKVWRRDAIQDDLCRINNDGCASNGRASRYYPTYRPNSAAQGLITIFSGSLRMWLVTVAASSFRDR